MLMKTDDHPPLHTATADWLGWTLDRTASLPKSARFTFGQRFPLPFGRGEG